MLLKILNLHKSIVSKRITNFNQIVNFNGDASTVLRPKKLKSKRKDLQYFSDSKYVKVIGGKGGDGCISYLTLWCNERAGPDGGDGGNGGHVVFKATHDVKNFNHVGSILNAFDGEKGAAKDCHGKSANHSTIKVPIGTVIKNDKGKIVADLDDENLIFVAARGGSGGKGNHFFISDTEHSPKICEYGAEGEKLNYQLELRTMADVGLIGFPNAGKSTLLRAISRARPKVASYPFTTLRPYIGIIQYDDYSQISVADLPGLIIDSYKNKGLGIQFLKHAERCSVLLFVLDISYEEPWLHYKNLIFELEKFSSQLAKRPKIIVANKIDLPESKENIKLLKDNVDNVPIFEISAKMGINIKVLLEQIKFIVNKQKEEIFTNKEL